MAGIVGGLRRRRSRARVGCVTLVGAGPGDPGLLTLRGALRLRRADVVYHDALVPPAILALCRKGARLVDVGKRRGAHGRTQRMIEALLVRDARSGLAVVRLKGGDPFVFGRGGEEALALARGGVPFEVIPGVSSGTSVPALAGIPLTHRGVSGSAAFVTAHDLSPGAVGDAVRERLLHLALGADTLVVFMAGAELAALGELLIGAGVPESTPAALIESGSLPEERIRTGTLRDLEALRQDDATGPLLLVIGKTVSLSHQIRASRPVAQEAPEAASVVDSSRRSRVPARERRTG